MVYPTGPWMAGSLGSSPWFGKPAHEGEVVPCNKSPGDK